MTNILCRTKTFDVYKMERPFIDRNEGGHLMIKSRVKVKDRTELTLEQTIEYALLSEVVGKALELGLTENGVEIGNLNWQEMGNWGVFNPNGITMHMHVFGRAKNAKIQKYGEAAKLPFRNTGFYDKFESLYPEDIAIIKNKMREIAAIAKYNSLEIEFL